MVVERRIRADKLAAVVGGDLQSLERLAHLLLDGFQADVVDQHIQRMAHGGVAAVAQPDRPERAVNGLLHRRVIVEIMLGLVQDQVAGGARGHDGTVALLFGQGQIARRQHAGFGLVHRHVGGRAAAVPVFQLLQFDAEMLHHRQQRFFVGAAQPFERTTGEVGVFHAQDPFLASVASNMRAMSSVLLDLLSGQRKPAGLQQVDVPSANCPSPRTGWS